jgi:hypothetical protein
VVDKCRIGLNVKRGDERSKAEHKQLRCPTTRTWTLPDDSHLDATRQKSDAVTNRASCAIQYEEDTRRPVQGVSVIMSGDRRRGSNNW